MNVLAPGRWAVLLALIAADPSLPADEPRSAEPVADRSAGTVVIDKCLIKVFDRALLAAERDGIVAQIRVTEGDVAADDQPLVLLRDDAARARLELVRARADNDINVRYSEKLTDAAKANYDAGLDLEKQNAISTFQLRQRKLEYERGVLAIEQAAFELKLAGLEAAQAEAELQGYQVTAPFSGVVTRVFKRRGESVQLGEPLVELVNTDRIQVEGYGALAELWDVRKGACVRVELEMPQVEGTVANGVPFEGRLILVDPGVQPVTGQVRVVAEVANRDGVLRDGLKARMVIDRAP
jgi:RND family efflux transporter MFP subunit